MPILTLNTDFGWNDPYVGIMKGVILGINPRVTLVDVTHGFSPQRLLEAAFKLGMIADYFPKGTIHLAVVDPGVGGIRRPIVVKTKRHTWVGPDNGIFTRILQAHPESRIFHLTNQNYFLKPVSNTFHGRDIFAPAAAHLSLGLSPAKLGKRLSDPVFLDIPIPKFNKNTLAGRVLYADHFGNLITNLGQEEITNFSSQEDLTVRIGRRIIPGLHESYARQKPGKLMALFGSSGYLEIACNLGSAAEMVGYLPGNLVEVEIRMEARKP
jgi:S-adenosyl-L-methionine hydrolase (adenosine-forming)